jgi:hypothetical protein
MDGQSAQQRNYYIDTLGEVTTSRKRILIDTHGFTFAVR